MTPETSNPFRNGRIFATQVTQAEYQFYGSWRDRKGKPPKDFVMSRSDLMEFDRCPARWVNGFGSESDDTKATRHGTIVDTYLLDQGRADELIAVCPSRYPCEPTKKDPRTEKPWRFGATYTDEWKAEQEAKGKLVITGEEASKAHDAIDALNADATIERIIRDSAKQVMVITEYHDRETGIVVPFKCLVDLVPDRADDDFGKSLIDFKTCRSAGLRDWCRDVFTYEYHVQGAAYLDAFNSIAGEDRCDFRHILSESVAPYQVGKRLLSSEFIELGRMKYVQALKRYCECLSTNQWPGYENDGLAGFAFVQPEAYMIAQL